jgi:hypothetical protein
LKYLYFDNVQWTDFNAIPAKGAIVAIDGYGSAQNLDGILLACQ